MFGWGHQSIHKMSGLNLDGHWQGCWGHVHIFHILLSVPQNIVMDVNNVMDPFVVPMSPNDGLYLRDDDVACTPSRV